MQAGPDRGGQPLEALAVPGRAARLGHQVVRGAVDAVREHGRDPAVRVVAERQLGPGGQAAGDRLDRRRRAQQDEPPGAGPHRRTGRVRRLEQPDIDRGARVGEGRISNDAAVPEYPGQLADAPRRQAGAGDRGRRLGQHRPQPRPELALELRDVLALGQDAAGVGHPDGDPQVPRQLGQIPGVARHAHPAQRPQFAGHGVAQVPRRLAEAGDDLPRHVRRRHQVTPQRLGQRPDHLGDQLGAQPRHLPGEFRRVHLVEPAQRDIHGHAVGLAARLEGVGERGRGHPGRLRGPDVGVGVGADPGGVVVEQVAGLEREQARVGPAGLLPPGVEMLGGHHVRRDPRVVEGEQLVLACDQAAAAGPVLHLLGFGQQPAVLGEEPVAGLPVPLHQRVPDEQLPCRRRVDAPERDLAVHHQRHPVQRDLLQRDRPAALLLPVRLAVAVPDQVPGQRLHPLRLDPRHRPRPQPGRLHQLRRHDPVRRLSDQRGSGEDSEPGAARAQVLGPRPSPPGRRGGGLERLCFHADLGEQASQQGHVQPGPFGRR